MKCWNCKEESKYPSCDICWESIERFEKWLAINRSVYFLCMQREDQYFVVNKCKWKDKRFIRKYFRNYFNWCWYESNRKNKLWKYYRIKI